MLYNHNEYTIFFKESGLQESSTQLLKKLGKFGTRFLIPRKVRAYVLKNWIHLCTKCHACDSGYLLTVQLVLFTKIYDNFKCT